MASRCLIVVVAVVLVVSGLVLLVVLAVVVVVRCLFLALGVRLPRYGRHAVRIGRCGQCWWPVVLCVSVVAGQVAGEGCGHRNAR